MSLDRCGQSGKTVPFFLAQRRRDEFLPPFADKKLELSVPITCMPCDI